MATGTRQGSHPRPNSYGNDQRRQTHTVKDSSEAMGGNQEEAKQTRAPTLETPGLIATLNNVTAGYMEVPSWGVTPFNTDGTGGG